ncbi:MAG: hypothetical protein ACMG50_02595 [Thermomonas sp.]
MNAFASRSEILKWLVAFLLATMLVGVTAIAYLLPVKRYIIACTDSHVMSCHLQRDTASKHQSWNIELFKNSLATVKIQPARRGSARVFLYLTSDSATYFAAEIEGGSARANAKLAAAVLNNYFSSASAANSAPVRVAVSPPEYLAWLLWGGIGLLGMLVWVICREIFTRKHRTG